MPSMIADRPKTPEISTAFKDVPLFANCSSDARERLHRGATVQNFSKGRVIFIQDDAAPHYYVIRKGLVKLFRETLDGTQVVVDIIGPGDLMGESAIFEDSVHSYGAEALEPAEVIALPLQALKDEVASNHALTLNILQALARQQRQQSKEIEHLSVQNAPQRIGCFLLRLAHKGSKGATVIQLPYDKMLVAAKLGMQPETFSRALAKLRDHVGIHIKGANIEIESIEKLSEYACAACSSQFPCKDLSE